MKPVLALVALALVACLPSDDLADRYSPTVLARIDEMRAAGDCRGLQQEFDTADANDAAQRRRTGEGTADLMRHIDDALHAAGCYG